jgi:hypothetical protein
MFLNGRQGGLPATETGAAPLAAGLTQASEATPAPGAQNSPAAETERAAPGPASPTPPPATGTPTATAATQAREEIIFADTFSDPGSGWPVLDEPMGAVGYAQGAYRIVVRQQGSLYWATPRQRATNAAVEVQAEFLAGSQDDYYGIVCRLQDANNFYYLVVTNQGKYTVGRYVAGEFTALLPAGWEQSDALETGMGNNRLRAECAGDRLKLFANGVLLAEAQDGTFGEGEFGLLAAALGEADLEVRFRDFVAVAIRD